MTPSVDNLAALLNTFDCAMLTIVDPRGHPRTRPMRPLRAPFNGHIWFPLGEDTGPADDIGRGAEVSVAYVGAPGAPHITVCGWAIVLRDPEPAHSWHTGAVSSRHGAGAGRLICVSARAAEIWDAASTLSRRVFAFPVAEPWCAERKLPQERALAPRRVAMSTMPCAS